MTSFGWKRKVGEKVSRKTSEAFAEEAKDEVEADVQLLESSGIDWLTLAPKKRVIQLEDAEAKSKRLREEGCVLAGEERYWEAIKKWDGSLELTPNDEQLYEMKAQALLELNELFPALRMAQRTVELNNHWWTGYQTLGRTQLGLGEVKMAIRSFSKAIHLNPAEGELWEEDLKWACDLWEKKQKLEKEAKENLSAEAEQKAGKIVELDEQGQCQTLKTFETNRTELPTESEAQPDVPRNVRTLPHNYVQMRD